MDRKYGILFGGGDAAGGNPVLLGAFLAAWNDVNQLVGFVNGWEGPLKKRTKSLNERLIYDDRHDAGTILGTSRTNPGRIKDGYETIVQNLEELGIDGLITVGGDDTNGVGHILNEKYGIPVVGIAWTMDGDLAVPCLGFDKAVTVGVDALRDLETHLKSHSRVGVLECFGRDSGEVAVNVGTTGYADVILIPEIVSEPSYVCSVVQDAYNKHAEQNDGRGHALVVVSEGHKYREGDEVVKATLAQTDTQFEHERLGGIGEKYAGFIKEVTRIETSDVAVTYQMRGGQNTWTDQRVGLEMGFAAVEVLMRGNTGVMIYDITPDGGIRTMPFERALQLDAEGKSQPKLVPEERIGLYEVMGFNFGREPSGLYKPRITKVMGPH